MTYPPPSGVDETSRTFVQATATEPGLWRNLRCGKAGPLNDALILTHANGCVATSPTIAAVTGMTENPTSSHKTQENKMRKRLALTFLGFVCSGVGCGSGGSGGGDDTAVALCTDGVGVICANMFQCPGELGASWGFTSVADCEAKLQVWCKPEYANCGTGEVYQPDKAPACIAAYRATPCIALWTIEPAQLVSRPPSCFACAIPSP